MVDLKREMQQQLQKALPSAIAELLMPSLSWSKDRDSISISIESPIWEAVFEKHARTACEQCAEALGVHLKLLSQYKNEEHAAPQPMLQQDFESFLPDPGNQFALATCKGICSAPDMLHNPVLVYGPAGVGKSHLLAAVTHAYQRELGKDAAFMCSGSIFVNDIAQQLAESSESGIAQLLNQTALICIDGLDVLSERSLAQEELYLLINRGLEIGQQLLFSARVPARRIRQLEERVSTRLAWGLSLGVDMPILETRLRLLRQRCKHYIDDISDQDLAAMVESQGTDMHQIIRLSEALRAGNRSDMSTPHIDFDRIVHAVSEAFAVRPSDLSGKGRQRHLVHARQAALLLGRRLTSYSLVALGGMVGGRDHSTVLHNLHQGEQREGDDPEFARLLADIRQQLIAQSGAVLPPDKRSL